MRKNALLAMVLLSLVCVAGDKGNTRPAAGQIFYFSPENPQYVSCDVEFRDAAEKLWPCFFYGKPAGGRFTFDGANPNGSFSILCDKMCQPHGDQSRKIIGELVVAEKPPVIVFKVNAIGPGKRETLEKTDNGKVKKQEVEVSELDAELELNGKKLPVKPKATFKYSSEKNGDMQVHIDAHFTVKGAELGLNAEGATGPINVRISMLATTSKDTPPAKKK